MGNNWKNVDPTVAQPWEAKPGDVLEGIYLGATSINGKDGEFTSYRIRSSAGTLMGLTGALLANMFEQIPLGTPVRVTFKGEIKLKSGRNAKDFGIQVPEGVQLIEHREDSFDYGENATA